MTEGEGSGIGRLSFGNRFRAGLISWPMSLIIGKIE